jgi:hypothetical protein
MLVVSFTENRKRTVRPEVTLPTLNDYTRAFTLAAGYSGVTRNFFRGGFTPGIFFGGGFTPGIFSGGFTTRFFSEGVQQIQFRIEGRENGDLGAVAP